MNERIVIDSREKYNWSFPNAEVGKLDVGDYTVKGCENDFVIERKCTVSELARNIVEQRWPEFLDRLSGIPTKYIICEFPMTDILDWPGQVPKKYRHKVRVTSKDILDWVGVIQGEQGYNIPVIFCSSRAEARRTAISLIEEYVQARKN